MGCEKGGGPYGSEVTRGQDLSGKDFSGKNLTKQDFKTVRDCSRNLLNSMVLFFRGELGMLQFARVA